MRKHAADALMRLAESWAKAARELGEISSDGDDFSISRAENEMIEAKDAFRAALEEYLIDD
jgi:hypothetical protein